MAGRVCFSQLFSRVVRQRRPQSGPKADTLNRPGASTVGEVSLLNQYDCQVSSVSGASASGGMCVLSEMHSKAGEDFVGLTPVYTSYQSPVQYSGVFRHVHILGMIKRCPPIFRPEKASVGLFQADRHGNR